MVKEYFRGFLFSVGLCFQFTYYFALFCMIVFLRSYMIWPRWFLVYVNVQSYKMQLTRSMLFIGHIRYFLTEGINILQNISLQRLQDANIFECKLTFWANFWTKKVSFFQFALNIQKKNTLLSSAKKIDLQGSGLKKKLFFWVKWSKRTVFSKD